MLVTNRGNTLINPVAQFKCSGIAVRIRGGKLQTEGQRDTLAYLIDTLEEKFLPRKAESEICLQAKPTVPSNPEIICTNLLDTT